LKQGKTVVVSISPQSRASIAAHYGLSLLQVRKNGERKGKREKERERKKERKREREKERKK